MMGNDEIATAGNGFVDYLGGEVDAQQDSAAGAVDAPELEPCVVEVLLILRREFILYCG